MAKKAFSEKGIEDIPSFSIGLTPDEATQWGPISEVCAQFENEYFQKQSSARVEKNNAAGSEVPQGDKEVENHVEVPYEMIKEKEGANLEDPKRNNSMKNSELDLGKGRMELRSRRGKAAEDLKASYMARIIDS
ncbi:unnamed protein product, partial [Cuscuta epithymum]